MTHIGCVRQLTLFNHSLVCKGCIALADPGGRCRRVPPPPNRIHFFRFCILFRQKVYASEVGAPPNGKSWTRHCIAHIARQIDLSYPMKSSRGKCKPLHAVTQQRLIINDLELKCLTCFSSTFTVTLALHGYTQTSFCKIQLRGITRNFACIKLHKYKSNIRYLNAFLLNMKT